MPWYHVGGVLVTMREISVYTENGTTQTPTIMSAMARDTARQIWKVLHQHSPFNIQQVNLTHLRVCSHLEGLVRLKRIQVQLIF